MILASTTILIDIEKYTPSLSSLLLLIWIASIVYEIIRDNKFLKKLPESEIRIKSKNYDYVNIIPFIFGFLICSLSIISYFTNETEKIDSVLVFIIGFLYIIQGLNIIPNAFINKPLVQEPLSYIVSNGSESLFVDQNSTCAMRVNVVCVPLTYVLYVTGFKF